MSHLLVTDDERDLAAFLCGELGAKLLLTDVAAAGEPKVADDPLSALPSELPAAATYGSKEVRSLIFWLPEIGPVKNPQQCTGSHKCERSCCQAADSGRCSGAVRGRY